MTQITWDVESEWVDNQDASGVTNDGLGGHTGRDTLDHGYEYGSLTQGLVAYYPFDGTVNDATPLGNDGTQNGDPTFNSTTVQVGSDSIDLDGTGDYVQMSSTTALNPNEFTLSVWVYADAVSGSSSNEVLDKNSQYGLRNNASGNWEASVTVGSTQYTATYTTVNTGQWVHLAAVYDGGELRLFVDGTQQGSNANMSGDADATTNDIGIGADVGGTNEIDAKVDDARIYDRPLSGQEIGAVATLTSTQTVVEANVL